MMLGTRGVVGSPGPFTLAEFWDELNRFDWYYAMSDDHGVWMAGEANRERLRIASLQSEEHKELMAAFAKHYYSGEPWGTKQSPKPERP